MATVVTESPSTAERARIYLAFRTVFTGPHASIRKAKKVREVVEQLEDNFEPLLNECGVARTVEVLKSLLEEQLFESETKAAAEFPELFVSTTFRDIQRRQLERSAAKTSTATLQAESTENDSRATEDMMEEEVQTPLSDRKDPIKNSLYPIILPYHVQHLILNTAQQQLEACCFEFAQKWLPSLLEQKGWDCPEAVELTRWKSYIPQKVKNLPPDVVIDSPVRPLVQAFQNVDNLRHAAVHRSPTTIRSFLPWITSAGRLAEALGDERRTAAFRHLSSQLNSRVNDLKLTKNFLEARFDGELRNITRLRAELDRQEKAAQELMRSSDKENMRHVASSLQTAVGESFSGRIPDSESSAQETETLTSSSSPIDIRTVEGIDNTAGGEFVERDESEMLVGDQATEDAHILVESPVPVEAQVLIDTLKDVNPSDFGDTRNRATEGASSLRVSPSLVDTQKLDAQNHTDAARLENVQTIQVTDRAQTSDESRGLVEARSLLDTPVYTDAADLDGQHPQAFGGAQDQRAMSNLTKSPGFMDADNPTNQESWEENQNIMQTENLEENQVLPSQSTERDQSPAIGHTETVFSDSTSPINTEDAELRAATPDTTVQERVPDSDQESNTQSTISRSGWRSWWRP